MVFNNAKFSKWLIWCIILIALTSMLLLVACNDEEDNRPDLVVYDCNQVFCENQADVIGAKLTTLPNLTFASKKEVGKVSIVGYRVESVYGEKTHNLDFELNEKYPEYKRRVNGYYIYSFNLKTVVTLKGRYQGDERLVADKFLFAIDGITVANNMVYSLDIFLDETAIEYPGASSTPSTESSMLSATVKPVEDISIIGITMVTDGMDVGDRVFFDGQEHNEEEFFFDMPQTLAKGEEYRFTYSGKLKDGIGEGSLYFILEYRVGEEENIRRTPFGYISLGGDTQLEWEQSL